MALPARRVARLAMIVDRRCQCRPLAEVTSPGFELGDEPLQGRVQAHVVVGSDFAVTGTTAHV